MSRSSRSFKDTQVFGWETEPHDERPSEFGASTGFSPPSGYCRVREAGPYRGRRRGMSVFTAFTIVAAIGAASLYGWLHLARG